MFKTTALLFPSKRFDAIDTAFVPNVLAKSLIAILSPTLDDTVDGNVTSTVPLVVSIKYPSPETAVKSLVLILDCQFTDPDLPKPVCVPLFVLVAPME